MAGRITANRSFRKRKASVGYVLAIVGAVLCVLILSGQRTRVPTEAPERSIVAEFNTIDIPVPEKPVPAGSVIEQVQFKTISYPTHQIPKGALQSIKGYEQAVTLVSLPAGLPVFAENLSFAKGATNPVLDRIPPGMRAMTVRVDATAAVEGWAGSGSVVDVLLVEKDRTSVIAEKVTILSAERSVSPVGGLNAPSVPSTVTLLVSQDQCLAINTAQPLGKIAFALRGRSDDQRWDDSSYTSEKLAQKQNFISTKRKINGVATVKDGKGVKSFALSGDQWLPSEGIGNTLDARASIAKGQVR